MMKKNIADPEALTAGDLVNLGHLIGGMEKDNIKMIQPAAYVYV